MLVPVVFLTSAISGMFGMAGGMILMAVLLLLMPLPLAMVIHAVIQTASNSWRCWLWRKHIVWSALPFYLLGVAAGFVLVIFFAYVPDKAWALIMMGTLPLLALAFRRYLNLTITNRAHAFVSAVILTFIQMTAGVVGPLLDTLYNQAPLTRQQIVSTKAFTQTCMHILRFVYYGLLVSTVTVDESPIMIVAALSVPLVILVSASIAGTSAAAFVLHRMDDVRFKSISTWLVMGIGGYCLAQGLLLLLAR
ncbi:MAG: TSUP family transporter [Alphaproteobacteria bacterium]|nr:TSUP family transporter [Alphaproteobacteria bacterium]